jgi:hypothetical protein
VVPRNYGSVFEDVYSLNFIKFIFKGFTAIIFILIVVAPSIEM